MKITVVDNTKLKAAQKRVNQAIKNGIEKVVRDIANDAIKLSPKITGNNSRSIRFEVGPNKPVAKGELEGAVYSTSGYGGWLEVGTGIYGKTGEMITPKTANMLVWETKGGELIFAKAVKGRPATPYFKPALDKNIHNLPKEIKADLGRF